MRVYIVLIQTAKKLHTNATWYLKMGCRWYLHFMIR